MNIHFDISKITRAINTHGKEFVFTHFESNDYGEPSGDSSEITIKGLFHQTRSYITKNTTDGTIARSKPQPQILTFHNSSSMSLSIKDKLEYDGKLYSVIGVDDIGNLGVADDISLELIDNGT